MMKLLVIAVLVLAVCSLAVVAQGSVVFSEDGARQARQSGVSREITHAAQQRSMDHMIRRELKVGSQANASDVAAAPAGRYPKSVAPQTIPYSRKVGSDVLAKPVTRVADECSGYTSPWLVRMCADAVAKNRWMTSVGNRNPQQNRTKSTQYDMLTNVMKTKHDTAKGAISNVR
jgi:hypothetical protein